MIEINRVSKSYRQKNVLKEITLTVREGSCVGILGGNGSGKSTLLSILAGVQRADSGSFLWEGADLFCNETVRTGCLGYVPQGNPLMEELTAWDNLRLWYGRKELKHELQEGVLAMLGIGEFIKVPVRRMSGGMKKRLSIGCSMANHPRLLLLDEPSAALDFVCKEQIADYLRRFKEGGGTVLLATHDVQELELCDAWYILKDGVLMPYVYDGDIHQLVGRL